MLRDAVHLGINPYGPDKGWTIGGPIDLGARRKTLHPSLCFCAAIGVFPFGSGGAAYMVVCPLAGPGSSSPGRWTRPPWGRSYPMPYPRLRLEYRWRDMRHHALVASSVIPSGGAIICPGGWADGLAGDGSGHCLSIVTHMAILCNGACGWLHPRCTTCANGSFDNFSTQGRRKSM